MGASRRLLLVGWDGVEWELVSPLLDAGKLPNLSGLVDRGALARFDSLAPVLSAPLWTTVATGRRPEDHGICGNGEPGGAADVPIASQWRRGSALWEIAARAGRPAVVVDWPASWPAGEMPGLVVAAGREAVPARLQSDVTELRVAPAELTREDLRPFVAGLDGLDPAKQPRLASLIGHLAASAGTQSVASYLLENEPWDFAAVNFGATGAIARQFIDLMPPRLPQVGEEEFSRYAAVMEQALILHDQMLGRLLALARPEAAVLVCSAHGWLTGERRPQLAAGEHGENLGRERAHGWAVLRAPGVKADELLFGCTLLDLAPNVLALLGLPVPQDWPGRIWHHAYAQPMPVAAIESHEPAPLASPVFPEAAAELRYLQANYLLNAGRAAEAVPLLEQASVALRPRLGPVLQLIGAYVAQRRLAEARVLLDGLAAQPEGGLQPRPGLKAKHPPQFDFMRGVIAQEEGRLDEACGHFEAALAAGAQTAELHLNLGRVHLACRRPGAAAAAFARGLEIDPENAGAHYGLAVARYRLRDFEPAAEHALEAASRRTEPPEFHLLLGLSLARLGQREHAVVALRNALARNPGILLAHRVLVVLHRRNPAESVLVETHRRAAQEIRRRMQAGR